MNFDDVAALASGLPEVHESVSRGWRTWTVVGKAFAWERPFTKADIKRFAGAPIPAGPLLAVRVDDLDDKEAVLAAGTAGMFTIAHFDRYPAILIDLSVADRDSVREALIDGWLACAPRHLADNYLST